MNELKKLTIEDVITMDDFLEHVRMFVMIAPEYQQRIVKRLELREPERFRDEYRKVLNLESKLSVTKRNVINVIGNKAFKAVIYKLIKDVENNTDGNNNQ